MVRNTQMSKKAKKRRLWAFMLAAGIVCAQSMTAGFCIKNGREAMNRGNCTDKGWYGYAK